MRRWIWTTIFLSACGPLTAGTAATLGPAVLRSTSPATVTDPGGATRKVDASGHGFDGELDVVVGSPFVQGMAVFGAGSPGVHTRDTEGARTIRSGSYPPVEGRFGLGLGTSFPFKDVRPANAFFYGQLGWSFAGNAYGRVGLQVTTPAFVCFAIGYERGTYALDDDFGVIAPGEILSGVSTGEVTMQGIFLAIGIGRWQGGL